MQRVKKGQPGTVKARVQSTRSKQMVLVFFFFNTKGFIYTNISSGKTVNVNYMKKALARFLVIFRKNHYVMSGLVPALGQQLSPHGCLST
jgi:hypothetical protein